MQKGTYTRFCVSIHQATKIAYISDYFCLENTFLFMYLLFFPKRTTIFVFSFPYYFFFFFTTFCCNYKVVYIFPHISELYNQLSQRFKIHSRTVSGQSCRFYIFKIYAGAKSLNSPLTCNSDAFSSSSFPHPVGNLSLHQHTHTHTYLIPLLGPYRGPQCDIPVFSSSISGRSKGQRC